MSDGTDDWSNVCRRIIIAAQTRRLAAGLKANPAPVTYMFVENPLPHLSGRGAKDFRECFVEDCATGGIRFTAKGLDAFGWQFAGAGIDIKHVRSRGELHVACERSVHILERAVRQVRTGTLGHYEAVLLCVERFLRATA